MGEAPSRLTKQRENKHKHVDAPRNKVALRLSSTLLVREEVRAPHTIVIDTIVPVISDVIRARLLFIVHSSCMRHSNYTNFAQLHTRFPNCTQCVKLHKLFPTAHTVPKLHKLCQTTQSVPNCTHCDKLHTLFPTAYTVSKLHTLCQTTHSA